MRPRTATGVNDEMMQPTPPLAKLVSQFIARVAAMAVIVVERAGHVRPEQPILDRQLPELERAKMTRRCPRAEILVRRAVHGCPTCWRLRRRARAIRAALRSSVPRSSQVPCDVPRCAVDAVVYVLLITRACSRRQLGLPLGWRRRRRPITWQPLRALLTVATSSFTAAAPSRFASILTARNRKVVHGDVDREDELLDLHHAAAVAVADATQQLSTRTIWRRTTGCARSAPEAKTNRWPTGLPNQ